MFPFGHYFLKKHLRKSQTACIYWSHLWPSWDWRKTGWEQPSPIPTPMPMERDRVKEVKHGKSFLPVGKKGANFPSPQHFNQHPYTDRTSWESHAGGDSTATQGWQPNSNRVWKLSWHLRKINKHLKWWGDQAPDWLNVTFKAAEIVAALSPQAGGWAGKQGTEGWILLLHLHFSTGSDGFHVGFAPMWQPASTGVESLLNFNISEHQQQPAPCLYSQYLYGSQAHQ